MCSSLLLEVNEVKTHLWHFRLALDKNQPSLEINQENYQLAKSVAAVDTLYTWYVSSCKENNFFILSRQCFVTVSYFYQNLQKSRCCKCAAVTDRERLRRLVQAAC